MCSNPKNPEDFPDMESIVKPRGLQDNYPIYSKIVQAMIELNISSRDQIESFFRQQQKIYHVSFSYCEILYTYRCMCSIGTFLYNKKYEAILRVKTSRSLSGVMVNTTVTSPYPNGKKFSCGHNCLYCPNEIGMPRSYDSTEPAVARANQYAFDPVLQFRDRVNTYITNGHPFDKMEVIVIGGTWSHYPIDYQLDYITKHYYAANTITDSIDVSKLREMKSLEEEMLINETSECHIIGLTLETRPDCINKYELIRFRQYGVTRVQMGIQTFDDRIAERVQRGCYLKDTLNAIKFLKDCGFKVDGHIMPGLPNPWLPHVDPKGTVHTIDDVDWTINMAEHDKQTFERMLVDPDIRPDEWKIYHAVPLKSAPLYQDYINGLWKPYFEQTSDKVSEEFNQYHENLEWLMCNAPKWMRFPRIGRDFTSDYIQGGIRDIAIGQTMANKIRKSKKTSMEIRFREIKNTKIDINKVQMFETVYESSGGTEFFLSIETSDETKIIGYLRLRLSDNAGKSPDGKVVFPELVNTALIRELHVYSGVIPVKHTDDDLDTEQYQHLGFGTRLVNRAFEIAQKYGYNRIAVISGVGVKNYYRRFGFEDENYYMTKVFPKKIYKAKITNIINMFCIVILIIILFILYMMQ